MLRIAGSLLAALVLAALPADAAPRRAGANDIYFGIGAVSDDEARIDDGFSLEHEQGDSVSLRWRLHFTDIVSLETDITHESGRVNFMELGQELDSTGADTSFFMINGVFNLTRTAISPYISVGFGSYDHEANGLLVASGGSFISADIREEGGLLTAALGVDGRTGRYLVWIFEVRYLDYDFGGFDEDWAREIYAGLVGISF